MWMIIPTTWSRIPEDKDVFGLVHTDKDLRMNLGVVVV